MQPIAWVYIITNEHNNVLYIGSSNSLTTRLWEHRTQRNRKSFSARYNLYKLVYFESFESIEESIAREMYMKGKTRKWKEALINSMNSTWDDLTEKFESEFGR